MAAYPANTVISNLELISPRVFITAQRPPGRPPGGGLKLSLAAVRIRDGMVWYGGALEAESIKEQLSLRIDSLLTSARIHEGSGFVPDCQAGIHRLSGQFAMQGSDVRVESLVVRLKKTRARLTLHANLADSLFDLTLEDLTLDASDLPCLPAIERLNAKGSLNARGNLQVRLKPDRPQVTGRLEFTSDRLGIKDIAMGPLEGSLDFAGSRADVRVTVRDTGLGSALRRPAIWTWSPGNTRTRGCGRVCSGPAETAGDGALPAADRHRSIAVSGWKLDRADVQVDARITGLPVDTLSMSARYEPMRLLVDTLSYDASARPLKCCARKERSAGPRWTPASNLTTFR